MSTLTSLGIGSGLDINQTVSDLVSAEREPAESRLSSKEETYQTKLSAYGALKSALSSFSDSIQGLQKVDTFGQRSASSSDSEVFTASADSTAQTGSYSIEVTKMASPQKLASAGDMGWSEDSTVGTGTLSIGVGGSSFDVKIGSGDNTLAGIRDAINDADGGVTASIINVDDSSGNTESRLVLTADDPGTENTITVGVSGDGDGDDTDAAGLSALRYDSGVSNLTETQTAEDAVIQVDGQTATRSSNSIDDVIPGVTIDLASSAPGETQTLTVGRDDSGVKSALEDMVKGYNTLMQTISQLTSYDKASGEASVLLGDATARGLQTQVRQGVTSPVEGVEGDLRSLADLGLGVGRDGQLSIDEERLNAALEDNPKGVAELFTADSGGVAGRLEEIADSYLGDNGLISSRTDGLQDRLDRIADQRDDLDRRMSNLQQRYLDQFIAMDQIVSDMDSMQSQLTQGLKSLPGYISTNGDN
ncbi:flagellar filament capping protein FliD [Arhodomonas aquaeolei]|uniref:flagellar filament capping protein FliD n=1 Tax=Arhodomonas aquaeolei TaxID=2369 RepID=UPI000363ACC4|nr:flagellar filament capping protein FliD [Arhodomonas aquaeolei]MCS4502802.1 flagellar filament capping protein FliD [Arhodomonas aquaeolei]